MPDTIVALATPPGRSGIGVIRLSGPDSIRIAGSLTGTDGTDFEPRLASLRTIVEGPDGQEIDEAVITYFRGPNSYTGEDVIEISCHGSPVVLRQVLDRSLALGARMAEPGEFTLRALAAGRLSLEKAEAIRDLIDAQSVGAARQAVRQLKGEFSKELEPAKNALLNVIVLLESAIEFVEDDLPVTQRETIIDDLTRVHQLIAAKAATYTAGKLVREGIRVALVGRPNVGKSSLFNAMVGSDRAIVTEIAGTTRDQIHERFTFRNVPISLIDTAGLRETDDTVESIGVERARRAIADADLVLLIFDLTGAQPDESDQAMIDAVAEQQTIIVLNKTDKAAGGRADAVRSFVERHARRSPVVAVSALTGDGIEDLMHGMIEEFGEGPEQASGFLVTDSRHFDLLSRAADEVAASIELLRGGAGEEVVVIGLHNALRSLGRITGETTTEDMLTQIFATFCIGK